MKNSWGLRRSLSTLELLPRVFSFFANNCAWQCYFYLNSLWKDSQARFLSFKTSLCLCTVQRKTNWRLHLILDQLLSNSSACFVLVCPPNVIIAGAVTTSEKPPCGGSLVVGWLWWFVWSVRICLHYFAFSFPLLLVFQVVNSHLVLNLVKYWGYPLLTHGVVQASWVKRFRCPLPSSGYKISHNH